jgi:hypothetical protein
VEDEGFVCPNPPPYTHLSEESDFVFSVGLWHLYFQKITCVIAKASRSMEHPIVTINNNNYSGGGRRNDPNNVCTCE